MSSHFSAGRHLAWFFAGSIILAAFSGCNRGGETAGPMLTVLDPRGQPSGIFGRRGAPDSDMMAIFNPETQPTISRDELLPMRMAPRLDSLDGKTIYLVNTGFAGSREFLEEMQAWFDRNMPSLKTVLHNKQGTMFSDSPELWAELKKKADAVVFGVGG